MFDFPDSPTENQTFSPLGGPDYIFKSYAWRIVGEVGANTVMILQPSISPTANRQLVIEGTSNTVLRFKYQGTDGIIRVFEMPLVLFVPTLIVDQIVQTGGVIAADPSVRRVGSTYHMVWTDLNADTAPDTTVLCHATSSDGVTWTASASSINPTLLTGTVLLGHAPVHFDEQVETGELIQTSTNNWLLYYSGKDDTVAFPVSIGIATSSDNAVTFIRQETAVLAPTPSGYDNDGCISPAVRFSGDGLVMLYAGHKYSGTGTLGVHLLAATSPDGITWTKYPTPLFSPGDSLQAWLADGIAEPDFVQLPDGRWLLLFTGIQGSTGRKIGCAIASDPLGPYTIYPDPILVPSTEEQVIAPSVVINGTALEVWYTSFNSPSDYKISRAVGDVSLFTSLGATVDTRNPVALSGGATNVATGAHLAFALKSHEPVVYSVVGGVDQGHFETNGSTLRWIGNGDRNYSSPTDSDGNNIYIVTVRRTDTTGNASDQSIFVTVDNTDGLDMGSDANSMYLASLEDF